jgi:site-specific DNA recombinase
MVPTFTCKGTRRYRYYETRRDLAVPGKPEATRFAMRQLDRHIVEQLMHLLDDEHLLRRLSGVSDGAGLQSMFAKASHWTTELGRRTPPLRELVTSISVTADHIELLLNPHALGVKETGDCWRHKIDLPAKRPFREAKVRIDAEPDAASHRDPALLELLQDASEARKLVMSSTGTSLNHIARRESRCRKQLARLLRVSWLSPRIVEAILEGRQPARVTRKWLLEVDLPTDWSEQEQLLGFVG